MATTVTPAAVSAAPAPPPAPTQAQAAETSPQTDSEDKSQTRFMVQWEEHPMHLASRLGYLLEHQSLVDVTLMCNTHTLKVHRAVLAACSPYFESVLQRQLGNHPLIVLKDMKFCVLKALIEFMYCGETSVTEENLNPLMEAAKFFEVKGLSTMSKEVLAGQRPSLNKVITGPVNGTNSSLADIIPSSMRGRGRRPGIGRGRRNLSSMLISPVGSSLTDSKSMLNLSGNSTPSAQMLQTTSRNVRISPNTLTPQPLPSSSTILEGSKLLQNGSLATPDLKALREQLNLEPRRRGRRRQTFGGLGRGRIRELIGLQSIKKEAEDQKDLLLKPLDSKLNLTNNNNGNNDAKSPLLASLLSKAEALAKAKVKNESDTDDGTGEQETILYQFDGESSGATKYLDALKEAGLPTDVPVLIDNGDGNYVTLTEDVLMNVLSNNEEFQFQVTEATLEQGDISEGIVLQDGTIMMTGKGKPELGPILTVGKKPVTIKGTRETKKRGPKPKYMKISEKTPSPKKSAKKEVPVTPKKTVQEMINEAMLENLKNGAATEAENDPDAVVMFEVTDNNKINKYVVSSKEINALKTLNEMEKKKKQNSPGEKTSPLPETVVEGNTNIAAIKLTVPKNSRKSIVSEVLARVHSIENQSMSGADESGIKNEANSPQMLDINMATDVLNDASQLQNVNSRNSDLDASNMLNLGDEAQILDESEIAALNAGNELMQIKANECINVNESANILVTNNSGEIHQQGVDLAEEPSEDSQLMQINEASQDALEPGQTLNEDDSGSQTGRDMPLLEGDAQLVEFELIDNTTGKKLESFRVEGTVLSQKEISDLAQLSGEDKDSDVIGLLNMVCGGGDAQEDITSKVLNSVTALKQNTQDDETGKECMTSSSHNQLAFDVDVAKGFTSRTEHLVLEQVQKVDTRHLESTQMTLDEEADCRDISVEQALQAMMGDEQNTEMESQEFNDEIKQVSDLNPSDPVLKEIKSNNDDVENAASFEFVYDPNEASAAVMHLDTLSSEVDSEKPDGCTKKVMAELRPVDPAETIGESGETSIISPTKDVPFAVGLLPLKDALVQIQSIHDHQPRKTRSGSTSRVESGGKRRPSVETNADGPIKRRKSTDEEDDGSIPNQILEEENIIVPS